MALKRLSCDKQAPCLLAEADSTATIHTYTRVNVYIHLFSFSKAEFFTFYMRHHHTYISSSLQSHARIYVYCQDRMRGFYLACGWLEMYSTAAAIVWIFSASASGISTANSSSKAMTTCTAYHEMKISSGFMWIYVSVLVVLSGCGHVLTPCHDKASSGSCLQNCKFPSR